MALALIGVLSIVFGREHRDGPAIPIEVAAASVGVVALWWRRSAPVGPR